MTSRIGALVILLALSLTSLAAAEEGSGGTAAMEFIGKTVNFLLLFGGLALLLRKPLKDFFDGQTRAVLESLKQAETEKTEALKKAEESLARLAGLEAEIQRMRTEAQEDARRSKERIAKLAAEESERIRNDTEQEIDRQTQLGILELKGYAAAKAAALARERIRERLTAEDQAALIDLSIERISRFHEESHPR